MTELHTSSQPTSERATTPVSAENVYDAVWSCIRREATREAEREPILASFLHATVLNHAHFADALSYHLSELLACPTATALIIREVMDQAFTSDPFIVDATCLDVAAIRDRDSACRECGTPFLYYKGFHALQSHRVAHWLWQRGRRELALYLQSRISNCFGVDIHPAAVIGTGLMLDHATGIVIGQTSVIGDNVSIMQSVTLGGTGKDSGDRHPKIGSGVLIGPGSEILGNIAIGEGAQICAGSVVLEDVPAHTAVAGVPAKVVGKPCDDMPSLYMNQQIK